jgi:hypothetical protein
MLDIATLYGKRYQLTLTGQIDPVGILRILGHLRQKYTTEYRDFDPQTVDWNLSGKDGKIAKQTARLWYQQTGHSLTDDDKMQIGTIARYFSASGDINVDLTDDFSWHSGDYGDPGSCFWWNSGIYRGAIRDANGSAIRVYDKYGIGSGRAWILPTFETTAYVCGDFDDVGDRREYVIFNEYGRDEIQRLAEALRHLLGARHMVPISVDFLGDCHINGGTHYLITDRSTHSLYHRFYNPDDLSYVSSGYPEIEFEQTEHDTRYCNSCQSEDNYWDMEDIYGESLLCGDCFSQDYTYCTHCEDVIRIDDAESNDNGDYCQYCWNNHVCQVCDICNGDIPSDQIAHIDSVYGYDTVCDSCFTDSCLICDSCQEYHFSDDLKTESTDENVTISICDRCDDRYDYCEICAMYRPIDSLTVERLPDHLVCTDCASDVTECHNCQSLAETNKYYDPTDIASDLIDLCDICARVNYDLFAKLVTWQWPNDQLSLMTVCQGDNCSRSFDHAIGDCGLCVVCQQSQNVPYVRSASHQGMIDYIGQQYRRYVDSFTPDLSNLSPVALLTGPISKDSEPYINYAGTLRGFDDPVCLQCDLSRVVREYSFLHGTDIFVRRVRSHIDCANCVHRPDAETRAQYDPIDALQWRLYSNNVIDCLAERFPIRQETYR